MEIYLNYLNIFSPNVFIIYNILNPQVAWVLLVLGVQDQFWTWTGENSEANGEDGEEAVAVVFVHKN